MSAHVRGGARRAETSRSLDEIAPASFASVQAMLSGYRRAAPSQVTLTMALASCVTFTTCRISDLTFVVTERSAPTLITMSISCAVAQRDAVSATWIRWM